MESGGSGITEQNDCADNGISVSWGSIGMDEMYHSNGAYYERIVSFGNINKERFQNDIMYLVKSNLLCAGWW